MNNIDQLKASIEKIHELSISLLKKEGFSPLERSDIARIAEESHRISKALALAAKLKESDPKQKSIVRYVLDFLERITNVFLTRDENQPE